MTRMTLLQLVSTYDILFLSDYNNLNSFQVSSLQNVYNALSAVPGLTFNYPPPNTTIAAYVAEVFTLYFRPNLNLTNTPSSL